ncbi:MAG: DUF2793 domain-containing protein [Pseudomonadota bacterium]
MSETLNMGLPLVQPSQAQKHVTVNEALVRLDALGQMVLASRTVTTPPVTPVEGIAYIVPAGAVGDWTGADGEIAIHVNGGWAMVTPQAGWRGWVSDEGTQVAFDGVTWVAGLGAASANGAGTSVRVIEVDHTLTAGATSDTAPVIPAQSLVIGVTARVLTTITGAATGWRLGVAGSDDRYGTGLGLAAGSWARGLTGSPLAYYSDTALRLSGEGGDFASGDVRLAVHVMELALPRI